jgi:hypothetical protein
LKAAFEAYKQGVVTATRKTTTRSLSDNSVLAIAWMASFFQRIGNHMPHLQQVHMYVPKVYFDGFELTKSQYSLSTDPFTTLSNKKGYLLHDGGRLEGARA